jgi:hypothetical protein
MENLTPNQHKYYGKIVTDLNRLKGEVKSIFWMAKNDKLSFDSILLSVKERIYQNKVYLKLPRPYRNEVNGYLFACYDLYSDYNIEWVLYYDGKYIGNSKREREATNAMYKNVNFDNSKIIGKSVYINTEIVYTNFSGK